jgi:hypothetical protein
MGPDTREACRAGAGRSRICIAPDRSGAEEDEAGSPISAALACRVLVVVNVGGAVVILPLLLLGVLLVRMKEPGMVVLVLVVVGAMLELAEHTTRVMMRHVVMVVRMDGRGMAVLIRDVPDHALDGLCLFHCRTPKGILARVAETDIRWDDGP